MPVESGIGPEPTTPGAHFETGFSGARNEGPGETAGLPSSSARWNAEVQAQAERPADSVLAQSQWSPNGMDDASAERQLPSMDASAPGSAMISTQNGASTETNGELNQLRMNQNLPWVTG